jgi:hypothetical protein
MYFYCTRYLSILGVENLLGHTAQTNILSLTMLFHSLVASLLISHHKVCLERS